MGLDRDSWVTLSALFSIVCLILVDTFGGSLGPIIIPRRGPQLMAKVVLSVFCAIPVGASLLLLVMDFSPDTVPPDAEEVTEDGDEGSWQEVLVGGLLGGLGILEIWQSFLVEGFDQIFVPFVVLFVWDGLRKHIPFETLDTVGRFIADTPSKVGRRVASLFDGLTRSDAESDVFGDRFEYHPLTVGVETDTEVRSATIGECSRAGCQASDEQGYRKVAEAKRIVAGHVVATEERVIWEYCTTHESVVTAGHAQEGEETERALNSPETT